jgi:hypothetical protein
VRIKSKFKDYYDGVQRISQDYDLVYLRYPKVVDIDSRLVSPSRGSKEIAIGFCGKMYYAMGLRVSLDKYTWCWNESQVAAFIKANESKDYQEFYFTKKFRYRRRYHSWDMLSRPSVKKWFDYRNKPEIKNRDELFHEHGVPIFTAEAITIGSHKYGTRLTLNAPLGPHGFAKIFDPYTAYQELRMWVANMAAPREHIPEVSDADMLEAKGFDPKWSFRKEPGKKKRNK